MEKTTFENYKQQIITEINKKIADGVISDPEGFILIEGFINIQQQKEITGAFIVGGPTVPAVAVVGKKNGLIHHFALKVLLPNIPI